MVALDVTDQVIYELLYDSLDEAALTGGAGDLLLGRPAPGHLVRRPAPLVRRAVQGLGRRPRYGAANAAAIAEVASAALATAVAALTRSPPRPTPSSVPAAGAALTAAAQAVTTRLAGFGVALLNPKD